MYQRTIITMYFFVHVNTCGLKLLPAIPEATVNCSPLVAFYLHNCTLTPLLGTQYFSNPHWVYCRFESSILPADPDPDQGATSMWIRINAQSDYAFTNKYTCVQCSGSRMFIADLIFEIFTQISLLLNPDFLCQKESRTRQV